MNIYMFRTVPLHREPSSRAGPSWPIIRSPASEQGHDGPARKLSSNRMTYVPSVQLMDS